MKKLGILTLMTSFIGTFALAEGPMTNQNEPRDCYACNAPTFNGYYDHPAQTEKPPAETSSDQTTHQGK